MYLGLQQAAIAALSSEASYLRQSADILEQRARVVVHGLQALGWSVQLPQASMYVWAALPTGYPNSFDFALGLAENTGVCVSPGRAFGERGEGYIRLALVQDTEVLQQAIQKLANYSAHITNNTL
jgi:LL-diaminopimelate aminotransferase